MIATNKPSGDNVRKGAGKKRSVAGRADDHTKRSKVSGRFVDQKEAPAEKKFKGVRREK